MEPLVMLFIAGVTPAATYLISLFVIKNYSQADIINLPTQPCTLNGASPTSEKKWAGASDTLF